MSKLPDLEADIINLPTTIERNESNVRNGFWPKMQRFMARVPFADRVIAVYYCAFDPETPVRAKAILLAALAYFIMPIDVIPDMLLGLGFTDDMAVIATAIALVRQHIKPEHYEMAREKIQEITTDKS